MQTRLEGGNELGRFRLPVSDRVVALRPLSGAEDLLLAEAVRSPGGDAVLAMTLASRLTVAGKGELLDWGSLSVTDLDVLVLRLRQAVIGHHVHADLTCPAPGCGHQFEVHFGIEEFLAHHAPRPVGPRLPGWILRPAEEPGWFCLARASQRQGELASAGADGLRQLPTANGHRSARGGRPASR